MSSIELWVKSVSLPISWSLLRGLKTKSTGLIRHINKLLWFSCGHSVYFPFPVYLFWFMSHPSACATHPNTIIQSWHLLFLKSKHALVGSLWGNGPGPWNMTGIRDSYCFIALSEPLSGRTKMYFLWRGVTVFSCREAGKELRDGVMTRMKSSAFHLFYNYVKIDL